MRLKIDSLTRHPREGLSRILRTPVSRELLDCAYSVYLILFKDLPEFLEPLSLGMDVDFSEELIKKRESRITIPSFGVQFAIDGKKMSIQTNFDSIKSCLEFLSFENGFSYTFRHLKFSIRCEMDCLKAQKIAILLEETILAKIEQYKKIQEENFPSYLKKGEEILISRKKTLRIKKD